MSKLDAYKELLSIMRDAILWNSIASLVSWDFETYMPKGAVEQRGLQMEALETLLHGKMTAPRIGKLLSGIRPDDVTKLGAVEQRNIHLTKKEYERQTKLPAELVAAIAKLQPVSIGTWKEAKARRDFNHFKPKLEAMLDLVKQKARHLNPDMHPYNVLLDLFEPGMTADQVKKVFDPLREGIVKIVKKFARGAEYPFMKRPVPVDIQRKLASEAMAFVTYNLDHGRLDETEHPFTTGLYRDVRICTHYHENDFTSSIYSILHEAGHGLYEQHLPEKLWWTPVGTACSFGIHESQSRFIENIVGKSQQFWEYFLPVLKKFTGKTFKDVDVASMARAVNDVRPSKIRIEADEVTYSLHVILRFEIEKALFEDKLTVAELPQAWNEKVKKYLNIDVEHDSEGVLQDTHWAQGSFGYFPAYALGNVYDGMMLEKINKAVPGWQDGISKGDIKPVLGWLTTNVHEAGNTMDPADLIKHVTGNSLDAAPFLKYLETKMGTIHP